MLHDIYAYQDKNSQSIKIIVCIDENSNKKYLK